MQADLVLEGGGVKGIGLVGAVSELAEAGYRFERVAGTSAGALVGALIAAGASPERLRALVDDADYRSFADRSLLDHLPVVGPALSVVVEKGIFEGARIRRWVDDRLAELGMRTFGDLRRGDPDSHLPVEQRYRLVVTATDLNLGRLVRLPWDYARYGLDPDEQPVADAVRASTAIPYFYEPVILPVDGARHHLVDGGLLSNFPVDLFDRDDGQPARFPTIGVKLSARPDDTTMPRDIGGPISYLEAVVGTAMRMQERMHLDDPCVVDRTVFVDTTGVEPVDFDLAPEVRDRLYLAGRRAARRWLEHWDWEEHLRRCPRT